MEPKCAKSNMDKAKHIAYWKRCHGSYLPSAYTANDSTRLTLAFFTYAALDLLSVPLTGEDRAAVRRWVLGLQHPDGGFCGSPAHAMSGDEAVRGTANLAATFFALLLLAMTAGGEEGDQEQRGAFAGVRRGRLLRWLRRLQRRDGSFGQLVWEGEAVGGRDMRHSYLAAGVRWMLGGGDGEDEDVDVDAMVRHIAGVQTYDGGVSEDAQQESHAGYAYCAVAALALLDRTPAGSARETGIADRRGLLRWLAHRPFAYLSALEEADGAESNYVEARLGELSLDDRRRVGFNGRWNKKADTCYTWWVGGAIHLLGEEGLLDVEPSRTYLLDITQHRIGGFSKTAGEPPDVYHSYLGLAALSVLGEPGVKELDVGLCCSREAVQAVERAREGLLDACRREKTDAWATDEFWAGVMKDGK